MSRFSSQKLAGWLVSRALWPQICMLCMLCTALLITPPRHRGRRWRDPSVRGHDLWPKECNDPNGYSTWSRLPLVHIQAHQHKAPQLDHTSAKPMFGWRQGDFNCHQNFFASNHSHQLYTLLTSLERSHVPTSHGFGWQHSPPSHRVPHFRVVVVPLLCPAPAELVPFH